ncbi:MAG TPA: hypothetical protein VNE71_09175 [Myxococcota bacterium]|nr:hypothetical protein [Myxococcota bacterium]
MSDAGNEGHDLERWLERVRDGYAPPPVTPAQRAAFDARLRERIESPRRGLPWLPLSVGAGLATAALAALLVRRAPVATAPAGVAAADDEWAGEILLEDGSAYGDDDPEDALPPQYAAIASAWLE